MAARTMISSKAGVLVALRVAVRERLIAGHVRCLPSASRTVWLRLLNTQTIFSGRVVSEKESCQRATSHSH